ncbi:MAG TPA: hypothetical protein VF659_18200 [Pyrinomonadaceae bacterium]|jgi:hypothetical protein
MRLKTLTLLLCVSVVAPACGARGGAQNANATRPAETPTPAPAAAASPPRSATCALLPDEDVREVQGEAPADAQGTEHLSGAVSMSQCFYRLPTFDRSFTLEVVRAAPNAPAGAVKDYWRKRFHPEAIEGRERARELKEEREREREKQLERERAAGQVREGGHDEKEEEEGGDEEEDERPRRVPGLGQEAYLTGGRRTHTLNVLKGDAVVRVGVSGPEDRDARQKKAAALAAKVLKRL